MPLRYPASGSRGPVSPRHRGRKIGGSRSARHGRRCEAWQKVESGPSGRRWKKILASLLRECSRRPMPVLTYRPPRHRVQDLEDELHRSTIHKRSDRANVVDPARRRRRTNGREYIVGGGVRSNTFVAGPLFDAAMSLLPRHHPPFRLITVNHNVETYPHRDAHNSTRSWIIFLGDFQGGRLVFEDGTSFGRKYRFFEFDGSVIHWNEPIRAGDKYSVIFYTNPRHERYIDAVARPRSSRRRSRRVSRSLRRGGKRRHSKR